MIEKLLKEQDLFSLNFYNKEELTENQKEEILKTLCLSLHHEVSQIISSTNFKIFDKTEAIVEKDKIIYNSVDAFRYILAILNLYSIEPSEFISAYKEKDTYLNYKNRKKSSLSNSKVIVFDIDDVIANFRTTFNSWINKNYNLEIKDDNPSYYCSKEVEKINLNPNDVFDRFVQENGFLKLKPFEGVKEVLQELKEKEYSVYLLTSRPEDNLKVKYQTYKWLLDNKIPFDDLFFSPEKYVWLTQQSLFEKDKLLFAVDDSPKHALEYATHGVNVLVPETSYNADISHENITKYKNIKELLLKINL